MTFMIVQQHSQEYLSSRFCFVLQIFFFHWIIDWVSCCLMFTVESVLYFVSSSWNLCKYGYLFGVLNRCEFISNNHVRFRLDRMIFSILLSLLWSPNEEFTCVHSKWHSMIIFLWNRHLLVLSCFSKWKICSTYIIA